MRSRHSSTNYCSFLISQDDDNDYQKEILKDMEKKVGKPLADLDLNPLQDISGGDEEGEEEEEEQEEEEEEIMFDENGEEIQNQTVNDLKSVATVAV